MESSSRPLSFVDATLLVMGGIIGVGIFFQPGAVAGHLPATGPFLGVWVLGAVLALAGAMTFAELGAMLPRTGGWYVFLREGFGRPVAFCFAWVVLGVVASGACAAVAMFFGDQLAALHHDLRGLEGPPPGRGSGLALTSGLLAIAGITAAALLGLKRAATLQAVCMLAKLLVLMSFVLAGLAFFGEPAQQPELTRPMDHGWGTGWIRATLPVLFTFGGWQLLSYVAPSVKDPTRTLPRAIVLGVSAVAVVYVLFNLALVRVLGPGGLAESENAVGAFAEATLGGQGARVLTAAMALSAFGFLVATLITTPGVLVAMAREGLFPRAFANLHARTGAPVLALLLQAVVTATYLVVYRRQQNVLADAVVFIEWIFHFLAAAALLRLAARAPQRPWRSPFYPAFPVLYGALALVVVVSNLLAQPFDVTGIGLLPLALGIVTYGAWRRFQPAAAQ